MKRSDEFREALGLLKREIGGIRGALERIEEGLARALDASVEREEATGEASQRVADAPSFAEPTSPIEPMEGPRPRGPHDGDRGEAGEAAGPPFVMPTPPIEPMEGPRPRGPHDDGAQPPSAVLDETPWSTGENAPSVPRLDSADMEDEVRSEMPAAPPTSALPAAAVQESSSSSAIDALLGGLFSGPSPAPAPSSSGPEPVGPSPAPVDLTELFSAPASPAPAASTPVEEPSPMDDELEQLLAATTSRAKSAHRDPAPEKTPDAEPPSSSDGIDALLGGLFHSKTPAPPAAPEPSSSDPDRFDLSVNALEDMLGGAAPGGQAVPPAPGMALFGGGKAGR